MVKRDMATLDRIIAKEWIGVVDGQVTTRAAVVADVKSRASKESFSYETLKVHVYGDTAVATGITVTKGTFKGKNTTRRYAWTGTWVKSGGPRRVPDLFQRRSTQ
jgi:ketosteroid isomerase-like protein